MFANDAGVVEPYAPNSSIDTLNTWSATFAAVEGQQYASTYAAFDNIKQAVAFAAPGEYRISVYAAAPDGTVIVPPSTSPVAVVDGEFTFTLNNTGIGSLHSVSRGTGWTLFSADFAIGSAGTYDLGIRNTKAATYFVNYDAFAIQAVPEPGAAVLALCLGAAMLAVNTKRRRAQ